jgi:hypothetical protein
VQDDGHVVLVDRHVVAVVAPRGRRQPATHEPRGKEKEWSVDMTRRRRQLEFVVTVVHERSSCAVIGRE